MLNSLEDVDYFLRNLWRPIPFYLDQYYNCTHVSSDWNDNRIDGNLTVVMRIPKVNYSIVSLIITFNIISKNRIIKKHMENGFLLPIFKYIMCKLNLEIIIKPDFLTKVENISVRFINL